MDIETRLRTLELRHRRVFSASIAAKAEYLALLDESGSTPASVKRARQLWETLDARKRGIAGQMGELENVEHPMMV
jgi:hypothetical protein